MLQNLRSASVEWATGLTQNLPYPWETIHMNVSRLHSFSYERLWTRIRFETEAQGNSQNLYMYNVLTNPSMKMIGHITLETPSVSVVFVFSALGSTLGKIVGIRQTKRPITTAIPQSSFRSVGLFRTIRTLWKKKQSKTPRHYYEFVPLKCYLFPSQYSYFIICQGKLLK